MPPEKHVIRHGQPSIPGSWDALAPVPWEHHQPSQARLEALAATLHPATHWSVEAMAQWEDVCRWCCQQVARGRIVARYVEATSFRPTVAVLVERHEGDALLVFDQGGIHWSPYTCATVDEARRAAVQVLASGQGFNW